MDFDRHQTVSGTTPAGKTQQAATESGPSGSKPQSTEDERYQNALADYRAGKLDQAARELQAIDSARARNALGVVLEMKGDHQGALAAFQGALTIQPDFTEAAHNAAQLLMREGRTTAAIGQLQSTIERTNSRDDGAFSLRMLLANAYAAGGQDKRAAEILAKLAGEKPDSAEVHLNLAITDAQLGALDAAVDQYRQALRLNPKDSTALMGLAKSLLRLKKGSEAELNLQQYTLLKPDDPEGYFVLGCDFRDSGRFQEAAAAFEQAARRKPDDYDIKYHWGMALWRAGHLEEALPPLQSAESLKPDDIQAHYALARVLWLLGKDDKAREESQLAERLSLRKSRQNEAGLRIVNGSLLLERGDLRGAAEAFRQALELDPESAPARSNLGLVLTRLNDPQGAERVLQEALALDPKLVLARNALGTLYMREGKTSEAMAAFQEAIRINPQYAEAKNNLGTLYAKLGRNADAVALFGEAVEDNPEYPQPYLNWGLVLASQGDMARAKPKLEKALQLSPNLPEALKALQIVNETLKGRG